MNNLMLPTDEKFVELIAMSIARDRLFREAASIVEDAVGRKFEETELLSEQFDREFKYIWDGTDVGSQRTKDSYRADARTAINKINLLLLTTSI